MVYRLKYYDSYYMDYRIAYESSLYDLIMRWGFGMDTTDEWSIYKMPHMDSYEMTLIGRSANFQIDGATLHR